MWIAIPLISTKERSRLGEYSSAPNSKRYMSVEQPLVSILSTNYNYGLYLREAIDSALNQTYPNTEVVVVDEGSTENSPEIVASYKDKVVPIYKKTEGIELDKKREGTSKECVANLDG
jgi:cellulose synthase/poly-beta-1,6-N-acetylglucosamine synthase-like glycosyltransferase